MSELAVKANNAVYEAKESKTSGLIIAVGVVIWAAAMAGLAYIF